MKNVIIASNNKGKINEFKRILGDLYNVLGQEEAGINIEVEETGVTFLENARLKAWAIHKELKDKNTIVIADDSGIIVDALPNDLGVYSARFSGDTNKKTRDKTNNDLLLEKMKGKIDRNARYTCSICCIVDGREMISEGNMELEVGHEWIDGNGFAFDFVCKSKKYNKYVSELTDNEKDRMSHRGIAVKKICDKIKGAL